MGPLGRSDLRFT